MDMTPGTALGSKRLDPDPDPDSAPDGRNPLDEKAVSTKARLAGRLSPTRNFDEDPRPEVADSAFTVASHPFFHLTYPNTTNFLRNHPQKVDIFNCLFY